MILDDAKAKEIVLNVMGADRDEYTLTELDKWIAKVGMDEVFIKTFEIFRDL